MNELASSPLIEARDVCFSYGRRALFKGLSLALPAGSITGLLGKNGEGKTTLLKLISGLLLYKRGTICVSGLEARQRSAELLSRLYYLPEEVQLPPTTTTKYFDALGRFYPNYDPELARLLLRELELTEGMRLDKMSMGQKKKAALASALSLRVPLLLLDEPTNGLDIPSKSKFRQLLARYTTEQQTVLISTHQVRDLEQMIDRLVVLHRNEIICNESVSRLEELFYCSSVADEQASGAAPVYTESGLWGTIGLYPASDAAAPADGGFSMEIFFNALITCTDSMLTRMQRHPQSDLQS